MPGASKTPDNSTQLLFSVASLLKPLSDRCRNQSRRTHRAGAGNCAAGAARHQRWAAAAKLVEGKLADRLVLPYYKLIRLYIHASCELVLILHTMLATFLSPLLQSACAGTGERNDARAVPAHRIGDGCRNACGVEVTEEGDSKVRIALSHPTLSTLE